jgi:hypothetical protein
MTPFHQIRPGCGAIGGHGPSPRGVVAGRAGLARADQLGVCLPAPAAGPALRRPRAASRYRRAAPLRAPLLYLCGVAVRPALRAGPVREARARGCAVAARAHGTLSWSRFNSLALLISYDLVRGRLPISPQNFNMQKGDFSSH